MAWFCESCNDFGDEDLNICPSCEHVMKVVVVKEEVKKLICVICLKEKPHIYSGNHKGSVHEKCYKEWLKGVQDE